MLTSSPPAPEPTATDMRLDGGADESHADRVAHAGHDGERASQAGDDGGPGSALAADQAGADQAQREGRHREWAEEDGEVLDLSVRPELHQVGALDLLAADAGAPGQESGGALTRLIGVPQVLENFEED